MLGEVVLCALAIVEAKPILVAIFADLSGKDRIERYEQLAARQFETGTETELIGIAVAGGKPVFCLNGHGDAIAPALHELI